MLNELALFAGAGGGILGGHLLGWKTVCAVEIEDYPRRILLQRQKDGILPRFPIWDDIKTFDGRLWRRKVDIISGGFPCQDISSAGKGAGIDGERSGLWTEMARVVCEVQPKYILVENSPMLIDRGLGIVLGDLAEMGYNARWCVLGADDAGAEHKRKRIWIFAYTNGCRLQVISEQHAKIKKTYGKTPNPFTSNITAKRIYGLPDCTKARRGSRVANRVDRIKAIGNGQVSAVAATAFVILSEGLI